MFLELTGKIAAWLSSPPSPPLRRAQTAASPIRRGSACVVPAVRSYPAERAPAEIRRFVTVVNSDLKGSTALGERLDPESLREVLTRYFDEMQLVFEAHGGTIEKIIGDAVVAVFGLPVRRDDDAIRAVEPRPRRCASWPP